MIRTGKCLPDFLSESISSGKHSYGIGIEACKNIQELKDVLDESPHTEIQKPKWISPRRMVGSDDEYIDYLSKNLTGKGVYMLSKYRHFSTDAERENDLYELFVLKSDKTGYLVKFWNVSPSAPKISWTKKNIVVQKWENGNLVTRIEDVDSLQDRIQLISEI